MSDVYNVREATNESVHFLINELVSRENFVYSHWKQPENSQLQVFVVFGNLFFIEPLGQRL